VSETQLPDNSDSQAAPPEPDAPVPGRAGRPGIDVLFLFLGIATPVALFGLIALAGSMGFYRDWTMALYPLQFVVSIFMFLIGLQVGNARLRSYGLGGLVLYGIAALLALLLFGTCMIGLN
jgi:hypothetical protein